MLVHFKIHRKESGSHVTPVHPSGNKCKLTKYARSHVSEQETGSGTNTGVTAVQCAHLSSQQSEDADSSLQFSN